MIRFDQPSFRGLTGAKLAVMRRSAGWSQKELACRAGLHPQTVKYWERQSGLIAGHAPTLFLAQFEAKGITLEALETVTANSEGSEKPAPKTCQAKTRKGSPCRMKPVHRKERCKLHGGLSTGPKTAEGRERIRQAQKARWQASRSMSGELIAAV